MSENLGCVRVLDLPEEDRSRFLKDARARAKVRAVGNASGLTKMGVWLRTVQPGDAGTARHFHDVEEEWAYVLSGHATVRIGPHAIDVRSGSFVGFPPGPAPHHFVASGSEPLVLLEGGERRPQEDGGWYVDLGRRWVAGKFVETNEPPPAEVGSLSQHVRVDELPDLAFQHPIEPRARRIQRTLSAATGLQRQSVRLSCVVAADRSTAYHTHARTDEWVYILSGTAEARVGEARFDVCAGDFLGYPAGGPAHVMEAKTDLEYLMGGMIDDDDVINYPDAGLVKQHGRITPLR